MPKSVIETRVYAPGSRRITGKVIGRAERDQAIKVVRQELEESIAATQALLATSDEQWEVRVHVDADDSEVETNPDGTLVVDVQDDLDEE
jgi:hypothetical protein